LRNFIMKSRIYSLTLFAALLFATVGVPSALAQAAATSGQLSISGDIPKPLTLSLDDLRHQPRTTLKVPNEHQANTQDTYEGVPLATLLKQTGMPQGSQIKGAVLATYLMAEGSDGYRVIFSLAEVDSDFQDSGIIVADTMNGAPLSATAGPLKLVVPHDKRPARSVRMLQSIKIVSVPK
jgi:DMSO/TMAO reductase YedYZ molybdopterin-dependent catalytic subunit